MPISVDLRVPCIYPPLLLSSPPRRDTVRGLSCPQEVLCGTPLDMEQPQQEWSNDFQRWLQTHWDVQYQRYYWKHYANGQWVFFDWIPRHTRIDSANDPGLYPNIGAQTASPARGMGQSLSGTYNFDNPQPNSHFETLDPSFCVRSREFFVLGKVFSVLFTEAAGTTLTSYNDAISYVKFGEQVHTQVRRFIVVRQRKAFCYAIPIFTYGNQGTKKPGVAPEEHAIAYSLGKISTPLAGEQALSKEPICIVMNDGVPQLSTASRIFFGIHHPIQYNVKVKDLGYVHPDHLVNLLGYWNMENREETNQAAEVTAEGACEDEDEE